MPTQKFHVKGLRHEDEERLSAGLRELRGVLYAVANHGDQCAEVEFEDDMVDAGEICAAIAELGYSAEPAG